MLIFKINRVWEDWMKEKFRLGSNINSFGKMIILLLAVSIKHDFKGRFHVYVLLFSVWHSRNSSRIKPIHLSFLSWFCWYFSFLSKAQKYLHALAYLRLLSFQVFISPPRKPPNVIIYYKSMERGTAPFWSRQNSRIVWQKFMEFI